MSAEETDGEVPVEDPDAPTAELTPEDKLLEEMTVYEQRWGKIKRAAEERRRRLLWKVPVNESDVETIANECELDVYEAEIKLQEHGGDVQSVLKAYILQEVEGVIYGLNGCTIFCRVVRGTHS